MGRGMLQVRHSQIDRNSPPGARCRGTRLRKSICRILQHTRLPEGPARIDWQKVFQQSCGHLLLRSRQIPPERILSYFFISTTYTILVFENKFFVLQRHNFKIYSTADTLSAALIVQNYNSMSKNEPPKPQHSISSLCSVLQEICE